MSEVRRDNKNRKLLTGESQDKDGRYRYKYNDAFGNRKSVYSWRLTESDPYPKGKRKDISLREKEKQIRKELEDTKKYWRKYLKDHSNIDFKDKESLMKIYDRTIL